MLYYEPPFPEVQLVLFPKPNVTASSGRIYVIFGDIQVATGESLQYGPDCRKLNGWGEPWQDGSGNWL
jgi:hypothetical protein